MRYISCIHALNLPCSLETCGDWHASAIQWKNPQIKDTKDSIYGTYGIETCLSVPEHWGEKFYIANTLRALLDLLYEGNFAIAQGAKEDFICNDKYTHEFFEQVYKMKDMSHWSEINRFMQKEYMFEWDDFCKSKKA